MNIEHHILKLVPEAMNKLFGAEVESDKIQVQRTRKELDGDYTVVVFPLVKFSKKSLEETCNEVGEYLQQNSPIIERFEVIKGFLNLILTNKFWVERLLQIDELRQYGISEASDDAQLIMIEYSSPNTNKPLHLGHIRNNLLGHSIAEILKANGNRVVKTNIVNDRGIHICKSMLAWMKWGEGKGPKELGIKGDHLVGKFYVLFDKAYKEQIRELMASGVSQEEAEREAPLMKEARELLIKWEEKDKEVYELWRTMNQWVYDGFDKTYKTLGITFDKIYYESDTYLLGKDEVLSGLEKGVFQKEEDGSVWADLEEDGLDKKILLRSDGTSVYMTQDIGTAKIRYDEYPIDQMVYVVGNEQNYHFQVLSKLLGKLGFKWGDELVHFSYGMVELPHGKMKSREGTVVDADDLIMQMVDQAREMSQNLGKLDGYSSEETEEVYRKIALGALKYFMLKVDPRKKMMFNPEESIDFNGNTGPFMQYTYARIQSILRRAGKDQEVGLESELNEIERSLVKKIAAFEDVVQEAGKILSPALIANYAYELAKEYNHFYHELPILKEEEESVRAMRILLSRNTGKIIQSALQLLGVEVPERM